MFQEEKNKSTWRWIYQSVIRIVFKKYWEKKKSTRVLKRNKRKTKSTSGWLYHGVIRIVFKNQNCSKKENSKVQGDGYTTV